MNIRMGKFKLIKLMLCKLHQIILWRCSSQCLARQTEPILNNPRGCQAAIGGRIVRHRQNLLCLPDLGHILHEVVIEEVLHWLTNA